MTNKHGRDLALSMLKTLPRISLNNIFDPATKKRPCEIRGRAQHGGDKHGCGNKGSGQRQNYLRPGYETGNFPFYLRFGREPYYQGHHLRRQYPPMTLKELQLLIDVNRLDTSQPIDFVSLINTGLYTKFKIGWKHYGVNLTDEGAEEFEAKVNIEVQWASEQVIAAIERNGGVITTAFYDLHSLQAMTDAKRFFRTGKPIPRRMLPPQDAVDYYSNPQNRGYLADPEKISYERLVLSQKFGYDLPKIEDDPDYKMLMERKDPRQIFHGLEPGWLVSLTDKAILKPTKDSLKEFYRN